MRIMIDTNILVSAVLFPNSITAQSMAKAVKEHQILLCSYVLEETYSVFERKFPSKNANLNAYLSKLAYEQLEISAVDESTPKMRDDNDRPILQAAINAKADAILTGDKDFHALAIKQPIIISPDALLIL